VASQGVPVLLAAEVESVIGTIRRKCLDHIIPVNEQQVPRVRREFIDYYHDSRAHQSLDGNAPEPRAVASIGDASRRSLEVLGSVHRLPLRGARC